MSLCAQLLRPTRLSSSMVRKLSATTEAAHIRDKPLQNFRTLENNPMKHTADHLHRLYTLSSETKQLLFSHGGLPKKFQNQTDTFSECTILVRSPAVELISYLNETDWTRPANRYVLYGELGTGKSMTMAHVLHYASTSKKIIVHVPWVPHWFKYPKEVATSRTRKGYFDLPIDGAAWLLHFKLQNAALLSELDIRVSKDYEWSSRQSTKAGAPLMELVDFGISRVKYSCDIIYALTDELKLSSTAGKCTTLVFIDGFNAFYAETSKIKNDDRKCVKPVLISLTEAFFNVTKYDWCNGAIVVSVDPMASMSRDYENIGVLPRYLLGEEGFEHLDPFFPIKLENYTAEEFDSIMEYYRDRKWLRDVTPEGQRELELLTARNPYNVMQHAAAL